MYDIWLLKFFLNYLISSDCFNVAVKLKTDEVNRLNDALQPVIDNENRGIFWIFPLNVFQLFEAMKK